MKPGAEHIAVALDTSDFDTFCRWCRDFGPRVGVLKVGLEAFLNLGVRAIEEARAHANQLFLDLKLHDIPNTVKGAVGGVRKLGVDYVTVHASGGSAMLEAAVEAAGDSLRILAVTLLTHLDDAELERLDLPGEAAERVLRWARLAESAGCGGVVCSPRELRLLRPVLSPPFRLVTPGIRPAQSDDDQRRVATPREALRDGADILVIGRPLTQASDPETALEVVLERAAATT